MRCPFLSELSVMGSMEYCCSRPGDPAEDSENIIAIGYVMEICGTDLYRNCAGYREVRNERDVTLPPVPQAYPRTRSRN